MVLLGIDIGTSFIKVAAVDADTQRIIAVVTYPEKENEILSQKQGWAEQSPELWWLQTLEAIRELLARGQFDAASIAAIGISYQMHGLVVVDRDQDVLRNSIIWCDSRAVAIGDEAMRSIGEEVCGTCLLNSPGNFTASKLSWVKTNEPDVYRKISKFMLPGDFIAMKLTGQITTTPSALSEGILWDFKKESISDDVINYFGFDPQLIPKVQPIFSDHGRVSRKVAEITGLPEGIPVAYKAGDQPNNALSLNVLKPGEVAANAGTSGVIYAVTDRLVSDSFSRVNSFVHVNDKPGSRRVGVLLCINGAAIMNSWIRKIAGSELSYQEMDAMAATIDPGSDGLLILPFGNGVERMLQNQLVDAHVHNLDLNLHSRAHLFRAVQEGIAFAFRYGLDIMRETGLNPTVVRAGRANLFLSSIFTQSFASATGLTLELYENEGSVGAALGAGIGAGIYSEIDEAFHNQQMIKKVEPEDAAFYEKLYQKWKLLLEQRVRS